MLDKCPCAGRLSGLNSAVVSETTEHQVVNWLRCKMRLSKPLCKYGMTDKCLEHADKLSRLTRCSIPKGWQEHSTPEWLLLLSAHSYLCYK